MHRRGLRQQLERLLQRHHGRELRRGRLTAASAPAASGNSATVEAVCKKVVSQAVTNTPSAKGKAEELCEKIASGDTAGAKQAAGELCDEVLKASPLPAGPVKEQALAACRSGGL